MTEYLKLNKDKQVHVVLGWREGYMDVLGVFIDSNKAYELEGEKALEYDETRVIESFLDEEEL
jgi:hypothetical protein